MSETTTDAAHEQITVIRVLKYVGPREWVERTLSNSAITSDGPKFRLSEGKQIIEVSKKETHETTD